MLVLRRGLPGLRGNDPPPFPKRAGKASQLLQTIRPNLQLARINIPAPPRRETGIIPQKRAERRQKEQDVAPSG